MESPDSYISSPEAHPNRSGVDHVPIDSDDTEKTTYVKFLVSNAEAGSVIGKGGTTITDFQTQSGARIQLSRNQEYFPGTSDRIIMVSGKLNDILKAVDLILNKLLTEIQYENEDEEVDMRTKVRLIVPNSCCGAIIGKGGATIKSLIEESQAGIKISPQDNGYAGVSDRLVTLTGSLGGQMNALDLILSKLTEDPRYLQSMNTPLSYPVGTSPYHASQYGPSNGAGGKFQNKEEQNDSVTIGVADEHIGVVLGRGGRNINEISQVSGARIKISDKGDFMLGTSDRKVTITGAPRAIRAAENMILQKVASVTERTAEFHKANAPSEKLGRSCYDDIA
ncbi:hypothetical protein V2J09_008076 [Rumex salicifolius]